MTGTEATGSIGAVSGDLHSRLRKIEGQVRGLQKMIEQDAYCVDVLNQLSAVIAAIEKVSLKVIDNHIRSCVAEAMGSKDQQDKVDELTKVLEKFLQVGRSPVSSG